MNIEKGTDKWLDKEKAQNNMMMYMGGAFGLELLQVSFIVYLFFIVFECAANFSFTFFAPT